MLCPCCSKQPYNLCCEPYHSEVSKASTAEKLMRSRYAAFALEKIDYLLNTSSQELKKSLDATELLAWSKENEWLKLEVISKTLGGVKHDTGEVEFKATYKNPKGETVTQHENSFFIKENGDWVYDHGHMNPSEKNAISKTHRNDPCPCGSGKKFKKCCG